jgi:hypothetical protein
MRILGGIIGVLVAGLVVVVGVAAMQPADFRIERSAVVHAPPDVVYDMMDDFTSWSKWSPWDELDPKMTRTMFGPESGVGAGYSWAGNSDVGKGKMEIVVAEPGVTIKHRLEFIEPFAAVNDVSLDITAVDEGSKVSWVMTGKNDLMGKVFGLFMNMDEMVGKDFEKGLAKLDQVATEEAARRAEEAAKAAALAEAEAAAAAAAALAGAVEGAVEGAAP